MIGIIEPASAIQRIYFTGTVDIYIQAKKTYMLNSLTYPSKEAPKVMLTITKGAPQPSIGYKYHLS